MVPGKTALHKTASKFFADKINAVTLQGLGKPNTTVEENINNTPNINGGTENNFTVFKTCLGETLIQNIEIGEVQQNTNTTGSGSQGNNNTSGGSGGTDSGDGDGTTTGDGVGTNGTGSSGTGNNNTPPYTLSYQLNGITYPDVPSFSIVSSPCVSTTGSITPTTTVNFTLEVNSVPATINLDLWGGDGS